MKIDFAQISKEIKDIYNKADNDISAHSSICKKGCSFCCFQPIEIIACEELPIGDYIEQRMSLQAKEAVKKSIRHWAAFFNDNYADPADIKFPNDLYKANSEFRIKAYSSRISCPFLIDNLCSIYEVRPLACRTHIQTESVHICENDGLRETPAFAVQLRDKYVDRLKGYPNPCLRYLPVAVSEILGLDDLFKPHPIVRLA